MPGHLACILSESRVEGRLAATGLPLWEDHLGTVLLEEVGGEFKSFFLTMGDYDFVAVYEAPDDAVAARFVLQVAQLGNIRTRTLKAFPEAAYREIIASLG